MKFLKNLFLLFFLISAINCNLYGDTCLAGDINRDGKFSSEDLVLAFQGGLYGTDLAATWDLGDWTGDGRFSNADLTLALQGVHASCPSRSDFKPNTPILSKGAVEAIIARKNVIQRISQKLAEISKIKHFTENLPLFLARANLNTISVQKLQTLYDYFTVTQKLVQGAQAGSLDSLLKSDTSIPVYANGLVYNTDYLSKIKPFELQLPDLRALALISFFSANPSATISDSELIKTKLRAIIDFIGTTPDSSLDAILVSAELQVEQILRSLRNVNARFLVSQDKFPIFDNLGYVNKPNLINKHGLLPATLVTHTYMFPYDDLKRAYYQTDRVHPDIINDRMKRFSGKENQLFAINLEHWHITDDSGENRFNVIDYNNLNKLIQVVDQMHKVNPGLLICYYRLLPAREATAAYLGSESQLFQQWQKYNQLIADKLLPHVDLLCPSLYTIHTEKEKYPIYAYENLKQARSIANGEGVNIGSANKLKLPVIAYSWPRYHPNGGRNPLGYRFIETAFYYAQLELISQFADGIVLWDDDTYAWNNSWEAPQGNEWFQAVLDLKKLFN